MWNKLFSSRKIETLRKDKQFFLIRRYTLYAHFIVSNRENISNIKFRIQEYKLAIDIADIKLKNNFLIAEISVDFIIWPGRIFSPEAVRCPPRKSEILCFQLEKIAFPSQNTIMSSSEVTEIPNIDKCLNSTMDLIQNNACIEIMHIQPYFQ